MKCPRCERESGPGVVFCSDCGFNIDRYETSVALSVVVGIIWLSACLLGAFVFGFDLWALVVEMGVGVALLAYGVVAAIRSKL